MFKVCQVLNCDFIFFFYSEYLTQKKPTMTGVAQEYECKAFFHFLRSLFHPKQTQNLAAKNSCLNSETLKMKQHVLKKQKSISQSAADA